MIDSLKALAVFARTVELGSFREAARSLGLSPSVVSHHVSALEARLSLSLLYRSTRRLSLTPDGEKLYAAAREMLAAAERGLDAVSGGSPSGLLRLSAPALLSGTAFGEHLAEFLEAHPGVRLQVGFSDERRDLYREGLDLALRIGKLPDSALKARQLAVMPRVLVASRALAHAHPAPRAIDDLPPFGFVHLSQRKAEIALVPPGKKAARTLSFEPRVSVDSAAAVRALVLASAGVGTLPELLVREDLRRGRLVELLPGWRLHAMGVHALWPGGTPRPALTGRFVDFLAPRLAALFRAEPGAVRSRS